MEFLFDKEKYYNNNLDLSKLRKDKLLNHYLNFGKRENREFYNIYNLDMTLIKSNIDKCDILSFDLFDTLLFRTYSKPSDLFKNINNKDFYKLRVESEMDCIKEKKFYDIYDIYNKGKLEKYNLFDEIIEELNCLFENKEMRQIYDYAKLQNKKIIITSDMYLPLNVIKYFIKKKLDWLEYDELYLSCNENKAKGFSTKEYNLFYYICQKENTNNIFHIGDNYKSDYELALKYIKYAYHLNFIDLDLDYKTYIKKYMLENKCDDYKSIGYIIYGPMMKNCIDYLNNKIKNNPDTMFLFCERDMRFLFDYFTKLEYDNINNFYLSRLSTVRLIWDENKLKNVTNILDNEDLLNLSEKEKQKLNLNPRDNYDENKIIENTKLYCEEFKRYLLKQIKSYKKIEFIDLGWNGTICNNLIKYFNKYNLNLKVNYLLLFSNKSRMSVKSLFEIGVLKNKLIKQISLNNGKTELAFSSYQTPSTQGYFNCRPVFCKKINQKEKRVSNELKLGIQEFLNDIQNINIYSDFNFISMFRLIIQTKFNLYFDNEYSNNSIDI